MKQYMIFHKIIIKRAGKIIGAFILFSIIISSIYFFLITDSNEALKIGLLVHDDSDEMNMMIRIFKNEDSLKRVADISEIENDYFIKDYDVIIEITEDFFRNLDNGKQAVLNIDYMAQDIRTDILSELVEVVEKVVNSSWSTIISVNKASSIYGSNVSEYTIMNEIAFDYAGKIITKSNMFNDIHLSVYGEASKQEHIFALILVIICMSNSIFALALYKKDVFQISCLLDNKWHQGFFARIAIVTEINVISILIFLLCAFFIDKYLILSHININVSFISMLYILITAFSVSLLINIICIITSRQSDALFILILLTVLTLSLDISFIRNFYKSYIMVAISNLMPLRYSINLIKSSLFCNRVEMILIFKLILSDIALFLTSFCIYKRRVKNELI